MIDDKPWEFKNAISLKTTHEAMMADFEGPDVDKRFRHLLSKAMPVKWGFFHHPDASTYYSDRVVLLGDSAHASLPFQAAGAGQGLEDSLILSNLLGNICNSLDQDAPLGLYLRAAFAAYDSTRRPRAQRQLERAYEMSHMLYFQHPETRKDMNKIVSKLQNGWFDWVWFHDSNAGIESGGSENGRGHEFVSIILAMNAATYTLKPRHDGDYGSIAILVVFVELLRVVSSTAS